MFHMCYLAFHVPSCAKPLTSTQSEHFTRPADEVPQICAFKARNRSRAFHPTNTSIPPDLVSISPDRLSIPPDTQPYRCLHNLFIINR